MHQRVQNLLFTHSTPLKSPFFQSFLQPQLTIYKEHLKLFWQLQLNAISIKTGSVVAKTTLFIRNAPTTHNMHSETSGARTERAHGCHVVRWGAHSVRLDQVSVRSHGTGVQHIHSVTAAHYLLRTVTSGQNSASLHRQCTTRQAMKHSMIG